MVYAKVLHSPKTDKPSELSFGVIRIDNIDVTQFTRLETVNGVDNYIYIGNDE
jgi:hypothetical protein